MTPREQIDTQIAALNDWRGELCHELRRLINEADPELIETWKWGTAVWTKNGLVCALSAFKGHVKVNFFYGAQLSDPHKLINNGFDSKEHRALDFTEESRVNKEAFQELVREASHLYKS
jgi:hypothetical protein